MSGIGSRFLVLSGDLRGREGVITECNHTELLDWCRLDLGADTVIDATPDELSGVGFKRLSDLPKPLG